MNLLTGAAGFDSSMFAHLKRNWSWTSAAAATAAVKKAEKEEVV